MENFDFNGNASVGGVSLDVFTQACSVIARVMHNQGVTFHHDVSVVAHFDEDSVGLNLARQGGDISAADFMATIMACCLTGKPFNATSAVFVDETQTFLTGICVSDANMEAGGQAREIVSAFCSYPHEFVQAAQAHARGDESIIDSEEVLERTTAWIAKRFPNGTPSLDEAQALMDALSARMADAMAAGIVMPSGDDFDNWLDSLNEGEK